MVGTGWGDVAGGVAGLLVSVGVGATVATRGGEAAEGLVAAVLSPCGGGREFGVGEAGGVGDAAA